MRIKFNNNSLASEQTTKIFVILKPWHETIVRLQTVSGETEIGVSEPDRVNSR
jgi:hypothetical protein